MIFISCSFDPFSMPYGKFVQSLFAAYSVQAYIAEHPESGALPEVLKSYVQQSDALVALITEQESPWQQTEITWAHELGKPVYGIVQNGITVRGLLPYITKYIEFSIGNPETLEAAIEKIVASISQIQEQQKQRTILAAGLGLLGLAAVIAISKSQ